MGISEVYHEDCMVGMAKYPDGFFHIAFIDIPYGIDVAKMPFLKEMNTTVKQKNGSRLNGNKNKKPYTIKDWDNKPPNQDYFNELVRVSKNQIIFGVDYVEWDGLGKGRIRWDKGVADGMSFNRYETAYCSLIDKVIELPLLWAGMCQAKSLSEPMTQQGNKKLNEKRIHPCHKPVLLYKRFIIDYTKKGDRVIDTHVGGGSSRIACYDAGLDFYGWEIDREYFDAQEKRFKNHVLQLNLF
jgi:site-specific DNA-methyltransferase (adenine-specific)